MADFSGPGGRAAIHVRPAVIMTRKLTLSGHFVSSVSPVRKERKEAPVTDRPETNGPTNPGHVHA